jgi:hypothetical protein
MLSVKKINKFLLVEKESFFIINLKDIKLINNRIIHKFKIFKHKKGFSLNFNRKNARFAYFEKCQFKNKLCFFLFENNLEIKLIGACFNGFYLCVNSDNLNKFYFDIIFSNINLFYIILNLLFIVFYLLFQLLFKLLILLKKKC